MLQNVFLDTGSKLNARGNPFLIPLWDPKNFNLDSDQQEFEKQDSSFGKGQGEIIDYRDIQDNFKTDFVVPAEPIK